MNNPPNKIFTDAMVVRMRAFAEEHAPTSPTAVADMLAFEFGALVTEKQVRMACEVRRIVLTLGQPLSPIRSRPEIVARIVRMVAENPAGASNTAIQRMVEAEFGLVVTPGQVAGMMHREGIKRGTARPGGYGRPKPVPPVVKATPAPKPPPPPKAPQKAVEPPKPVEVAKPPEPAPAPSPTKQAPARDTVIWYPALEQQRKRDEMLRWALRR